MVATKLRFPACDPGGQGLDADRVRAACDASLRRLGIDEIDLYQVHAPDPEVPLEQTLQTLQALDGLARSGKVRALGVSNFRDGSWRGRWRCRIARAGRRSSRCNRSTPSSSVPSSSTCCRSAAPQGSACCPGGPLGAGFLSGTYRRDEAPPAASRMAQTGDDWEEALARRAVERNFRVLDAVEEIAEERDVPVRAVAIAWLLGVDGVTAPIIGPRTVEHLEGLLPAVELTHDDDERAWLEAPAPPPPTYPQRMLAEQGGLTVLTPPLTRHSP